MQAHTLAYLERAVPISQTATALNLQPAAVPYTAPNGRKKALLYIILPQIIIIIN